MTTIASPLAALQFVLLVLAIQNVCAVQVGNVGVASSPSRSKLLPQRLPYVVPPGGDASTLAADEEDEYDEYEEDEEDEELDPSMVNSMLKSSRKSKAKAAAAVKAEVSSQLKSKTTKKQSRRSIVSHIPYIIRASLNPFTVLAMTKAYFQSLFNFNFPKKEGDTAGELRSALEAKAKKSGSSGGGRNKGRRQMRPGQAKTLSDLPALNT
uniref:Uncharacterized protein n=1 Tax=Grammatophora oceanica TaxID=210454 RepID=A0A7S1YH44_9STRA|mmetsp:Transcript_46323/g.68965  ORF Transcript_46323/g.68965 Transcript_46323/m.68965 type:complete len:210 (+) Transcript_46323:35-664(+)|eukprot:CAMPEP_0194046766 /NCGR_PEP_ID=MMETSP0009_2-20130614/22290_1 /TAXON_ID=210454 /ORGANISM="Grammatophora oceanica, Strain CCMP 410" /LENGTH=209 /DNA_ID=CAMNT_0038692177 /DNA_START=13 /DNA_END=642 /DNA_ORIENTATION=-